GCSVLLLKADERGVDENVGNGAQEEAGQRRGAEGLGGATAIGERLRHAAAEPLAERGGIGAQEDAVGAGHSCDVPDAGAGHARPPRNSRRAAVTCEASRSTSARATAWPSGVSR